MEPRACARGNDKGGDIEEFKKLELQWSHALARVETARL